MWVDSYVENICIRHIRSALGIAAIYMTSLSRRTQVEWLMWPGRAVIGCRSWHGDTWPKMAWPPIQPGRSDFSYTHVSPLIIQTRRHSGPVYARRKFSVALLLVRRRRRWANIKPTLGQKSLVYKANETRYLTFSYTTYTQKEHWPIARLLLDRRLRRWSNIDPVLGWGVVFAGLSSKLG